MMLCSWSHLDTLTSCPQSSTQMEDITLSLEPMICPENCEQRQAFMPINQNTNAHKVYANSLQEDVVNHYRIGPDPDHVRKLVIGPYDKLTSDHI